MDASVQQIVSVGEAIVGQVTSIKGSLSLLVHNYGLGGLVLWVFGSGEIWRMQMRVLESSGDQVAMEFKASVQNESNMVAVAGSILAEIAITALSLEHLSQVHWVARGFFILSLISTIMAVYYASDQYRILSRYLHGDEVKAWIRNNKRTRRHLNGRSRPDHRELPSPASVLTISAPNILLSTSLNSFLLGLGIYLVYVWTRNLDAAAGTSGSRADFIIYIVSLTFCYGIYQLSRVVVARQSYTSDVGVGPSSWERIAPSKGRTLDPPKDLQANENGISDNISMKPLRVDDEASRSQSVPQTEAGFTVDGGHAAGDTIQTELIRAFKESAQLRRDSAAADERIAQLYERLSQQSRKE